MDTADIQGSPSAKALDDPAVGSPAPPEGSLPRRSIDAPRPVHAQLRSLFVAAPKRPITGPAALIAALAVLAGTAISIYGQRGALNTVWAEDGGIFYQATLRHGLLETLSIPYNGYYQLLPRLMIQLVRVFPLTAAAEAMAIIGAVTTSCLAVLVYAASSEHLSSRIVRFCVSAPVAVLYVAQEELGNNIVNIPWYMVYVAFWMLLWNPEETWRRWLAAIVLFLTAASDPTTVVLLPLAVTRVAVVRGRRGFTGPAAFVAGLAYQAEGLLFQNSYATRVAMPSRYDPLWASSSYLKDVVLPSMVGGRWWAEPGSHTTALIVATGLLVGFLIIAAFRLTEPRWMLACAAVVSSYVLYLPLVMQGGVRARYVGAPTLLLLAGVAALVVPRARRQWPAIALAALIAVVISLNLHTDSIRTKGPSWSAGVATATKLCASDAKSWVDVGISPRWGRVSAWNINLPCTLVRNQHKFFQIQQYRG